MSGFHYEKELPHQELAVEAVLQALDGATIETVKDGNGIAIDDRTFRRNIMGVQRLNRTEDIPPSDKRVLDISMETGTGKTYTYTKTMYDLHRLYGVFKFIVVVPTLSIKAGTENFLKSTALAEHFRLDFEGMYGNTEIELYTVQSQKAKKAKKGKKSSAISTINRFVSTTNKNKIHVLLINAGMINSDTLAGTDSSNDGSTLFKDEFAKPFEAIASVKPFVIIDEPHKFVQSNKTWGNIQKFKPVFIIRYGATFNNQYENLLYRLTAVDAFNNNLVKGVNVFVQKIEGDDGTMVELAESSKDKAVFKRIETNKTKSITLKKGDSLATVHPMMTDLFIEAMNNSTVLLSNGLELKKGDKLNPYSYDATVADNMLRQAIQTHFDLEKQLITRPNGRLKPLTLFFIDNIASYRDGKEDPDSLLNRFEAMVKNEAKKRLEKESDEFYCTYLEKTLSDISATHGGYFSKDNSDKDEEIEKEVQEILHDKESLLSLDNPRRFIFSKWTLREGWDNPNVFGICKLRSSGSETNKLQEVGRGLRLPVNEYMARVKDESFYLNYFVDSSEQDFANQLIGEVNSTVDTATPPDRLTDDLIEKIKHVYPDETRRSISNRLYDEKLIDENDHFMGENAFAQVKLLYPLAFSNDSVKPNKIRNADDNNKQKVAMRTGKYAELKTLWEAINQKVILQYNIDKEEDFLNLFIQYLKDNQAAFKQSGIRTQKIQIRTQGSLLTATHQESIEEINFEPIPMMGYEEFLLKLSQATFIKRTTLHQAFQTVKDSIDIELFLNQQTINGIKSGFNRWLLFNSLTKFDVSYTQMSVNVHPTKFTDAKGVALPEIPANNLGTGYDENAIPLPQYLFDKVFFDSELEKQNITQNEINEVIVFTKIPKNSIKVPVAGGGTYSPDFAYIVKTSKGDILNLVLETKNVADTDSLRREEAQKIKHAEKMFATISEHTKVIFKTQFEGESVADIIRSYIN